mmetsp:Transcript_33359/g.87502  ORF Transcript_33359/g.87502 Transcript_33359/m.87502 type:complete len:210 (-) Transcript_33359:791-1420(-)
MGNCGGKPQLRDAQRASTRRGSSTVRRATSPFAHTELKLDVENFSFIDMTKLHLERLNKMSCHVESGAPWLAKRGSRASLTSGGGYGSPAPPANDATTEIGDEVVVRPTFSNDHAKAVPTSAKKDSQERAASLVDEGVIDAAHAAAYIESQHHLDSVKDGNTEEADAGADRGVAVAVENRAAAVGTTQGGAAPTAMERSTSPVVTVTML